MVFISTHQNVKLLIFFGHDSAKFFLRSDNLPFDNQIEDLGFIVFSTLSWKAHPDSKLLKCNRIFNFLKRNIPFSVSSHRKLLLYRSLLLPILLYGARVWSPSLTMLHQLERFQYKVLRCIIRCSSYVSGLESLQLLPVCYSLIRDDIVFLWKLYNGAVDVQCRRRRKFVGADDELSFYIFANTIFLEWFVSRPYSTQGHFRRQLFQSSN